MDLCHATQIVAEYELAPFACFFLFLFLSFVCFLFIIIIIIIKALAVMYWNLWRVYDTLLRFYYYLSSKYFYQSKKDHTDKWSGRLDFPYSYNLYFRSEHTCMGISSFLLFYKSNLSYIQVRSNEWMEFFLHLNKFKSLYVLSIS